MVLVYTFFKLYISKIYSGFSLYIYIYIYIWFKILLVLDSLIFAPNNSLATKIKILDRDVAKKGTSIKI